LGILHDIEASRTARRSSRSSASANSFPNAQAGRIVFAPDGTLTGSQQGNVGGVPNEPTFAGTYSVNSDCTGTMSHTLSTNGSVVSVAEFAFAIVQSGAEIEFAFHNSSSPRVGEGVMKKQ